MSSFTTPLRFEMVSGRLFELTEPFEYHVGEFPSEQVITVPKGFVTDLASVPRAFWPVFPPHGEYAKAAVVHDYLYRFPSTSREFADSVFDEAMGVLGVASWKRWLITTAVRLFGGRYFGK